MIWLMIIIFLIGISFGCVISDVLHKKKETPTVGTLRIDKSDPEDGPYIFLELETDPIVLEKRKHVSLKISNKSYISQK